MKKLLTETELAEQIGVHRNTLRSWREQGAPYTGGPRSLRYDPELVLEWRKQKDKELPGGIAAREILDAKYDFMESEVGKAIYKRLDGLYDRLPDDLQEEFQTFTTNVIHATFEAGWRARR